MMTPRAPHFAGGLWEASVMAVNFHLKKITGNTFLTYKEFLALVVEIEAVSHLRPLSPMSFESNDLEPFIQSWTFPRRNFLLQSTRSLNVTHASQREKLSFRSTNPQLVLESLDRRIFEAVTVEVETLWNPT